MPEAGAAADNDYPTWMGFIFIFNLIVGTGALTLPAVFVKAGWLLSLSVIVVLAVISYMTVTFVVETMACANAVRNWQTLQLIKRRMDNRNMAGDAPPHGNEGDLSENELDADPTHLLLPREAQEEESAVADPTTRGYGASSMLYYYRLDKKFEMGEMAELFFSKTGRMLFYLCLAIYLTGDMSIYSAAVAKSLRDVFCNSGGNASVLILSSSIVGGVNNDWEDTLNGTALCWPHHTLSRFEVYRLFIVGFTLLFGPFAIFSVQKTKYIQLLTMLFRWLAFTFMISIAIKLLLTQGPQGHPPLLNVHGLPSLFGACIYSYMSHHSLPSLLSPVRNKRQVLSLLSYDYALICFFYALLAMTGIYAFAHLEDLYTLNFIPTSRPGADNHLLLIIDYFLALFPVFTLSATYPILAITLRNNLQTLFLDMSRFDTYNFCVRNLLFPLMAISPPFAITFFTEDLTNLVKFTGSYPGAFIQYLIPISLVYFARRTCVELLGSGVLNSFQSPFKSNYWLMFVFVWALACMGLVTVNIWMSAE